MKAVGSLNGVPNDVGRIAQQVGKGEGGKEGKYGESKLESLLITLRFMSCIRCSYFNGYTVFKYVYVTKE